MFNRYSFLSIAMILSCASGDESKFDNHDVPAFTGPLHGGSFPIIISNEWSFDDQAKVLRAISFWEVVFEGSNVELLVTIAECEDESGCIRPVEYDPVLKEFDDPNDDFTVVGLHNMGVISILYDFEDIEAVAAHELGHYFGLGHEDVGIMTPSVSDASYALGSASIEALKIYGLLTE